MCHWFIIDAIKPVIIIITIIISSSTKSHLCGANSFKGGNVPYQQLRGLQLMSLEM